MGLRINGMGLWAPTARRSVVNANCLVKATPGSGLANLASYATSLAAKP